MPRLGEIVHYRLTEADCTAIHASRSRDEGRGNPVAPGETMPMIVTKVWSRDCLNGQVVMDGDDSLWVTSVTEGDKPGTWCWSGEGLPKAQTQIPAANWPAG